MHRRDFHRTAGCATVASLTTFPARALRGATQAAPPPPGTATLKPFLFLDLGKLDACINCKLVQGAPTYDPSATYEDASGGNAGASKPSIFFDREAGLWRMIYNLGWSPIRLMAAVSEDGIHWEKDPHPEISPDRAFGPRVAEHHVFSLPDATAGGIYYDPISADGKPYKIFAHQRGKTVLERALSDPTHRWHAIAKAEGQKRYFHDALMLESADGLQWQVRYDRNWSRPDWYPEPPYFGFFDHHRQQHVMTVRPGWGDRRIASQRTVDFQTWSDPEMLLHMDAIDTDPIGLYAMPVCTVGHMFIGLPWIFHNASSRPVNSFNQFFGSMDAQLAYSYDGTHFVRGLREPFLKLNPYPEHGCTQLRPYSMVEHDGEIRIYSGAARAPHGRERALQSPTSSTKAITLHRMRKDGWMCLKSKGDWARIQTKPLGIWSDAIHLNASAPFGEVRYQVTDEKSQPIEGFTFADCLPLRTDDQLKFQMRWKQASVNDLAGKVVRIEIEFQNAQVYSLTCAYHMLDAEDQWLMKDGKPVDTSRFDY